MRNKLLLIFFVFFILNSKGQEKQVDDIAQVINFSDYNHFIMVQININNEDCNTILDTGYSGIVLDSTFFFDNICSENMFTYEAPKYKMYYWRAYYKGVLNISFGKYKITTQYFEVKNLKKLYSDNKIDALLGEAIFEDKMTQINYSNSKILFADSISIPSGYEPISMFPPREINETNKNQKYIKITGLKSKDANPKEGYFLLDTGCSGGGIILKKSFADQLSLKVTNAKIKSSFYNYNGNDYLWRLDSLFIGNLVLNNAPVRTFVGKNGDVVEMLKAGDGLLGLALLKRFDLILDYKNSILYIKPNRYYLMKN